MRDYNTIQFEFPLDDRHEHMGILSHYGRSVERGMDLEILEPGKKFLGMIINLSAHAHDYRIAGVSGTLEKLHYNFFYIPPDSSSWHLEPSVNSILFLQCDAVFLHQFTGEVPALDPFLADVAINKRSMLTEQHSPVPAEMLDNIMELMREHRLTGITRETYLRWKSSNMIVLGLMNSQAEHTPVFSEPEVQELRRIYQYIVDNMRHLTDTRELMALTNMSETTVHAKFRRLFGRSMFATLRYERMKRAVELLKDTHLPVQEIAVRLGYASPAPFLNAFRKEYGVYPTEYRQRYLM